MDTFLFAGFALAYAVLLVCGVVLAARYGWATTANVVLLVLAGLLYDNTVLALGRYIGAGPLLEALNAARFWMHALLTPLLVLFARSAMARASLQPARHRWALVLALLIYGSLVAVELVTQVLGLSLHPAREYGVLSYEPTDPASGPSPMVVVVTVALLVSAVVVLRKQRWPWYLLGVVLMGIGSAVPVPVDSAAATNAFELVLLTSLLATKRHQDRLVRPSAVESSSRRREAVRPFG